MKKNTKIIGKNTKLKVEKNIKIRNYLSNLILIFVISIVAYLFYANIAHMIYLHKIENVVVTFENIEPSIKKVDNVRKNIDLIKTNSLNVDEKDKEKMIELLEILYQEVINDNLYNIEGNTSFKLDELYSINLVKEVLTNIELIKLIDKYDENDLIDIEEHIDLSLLKMINEGNFMRRLNRVDNYQNPFSFKITNNRYNDSIEVMLNFRMKVNNLNSMTKYILEVGDINE